ncbi:MAG: hypothetical protein ACK49N_04545 [Verrucomicrobiota bacterium]
MICDPSTAHDPFPLRPDEIPLWKRVIEQFLLPEPTYHGVSHWLAVLRLGMQLCRHHPADAEIVRLFALFHDSRRQDEQADPGHGPRGAQLAIDFRQAGHFHLDDLRMELLVTACRIHNGGPAQTEPTLAVCLDADRLDLPRFGITLDPERLSTTTAKAVASI